jgi:hypothetical protein
MLSFRRLYDLHHESCLQVSDHKNTPAMLDAGVLSESLSSLSVNTFHHKINIYREFEVGAIGLYKKVFKDLHTNKYSYVEETSIITKINRSTRDNGSVFITVSPVIHLNDDIATYVDVCNLLTGTVKGDKLAENTAVSETSFELTNGRPILRTEVRNGMLIEKNGKIVENQNIDYIIPGILRFMANRSDGNFDDYSLGY